MYVYRIGLPPRLRENARCLGEDVRRSHAFRVPLLIRDKLWHVLAVHIRAVDAVNRHLQRWHALLVPLWGRPR